VVRLEQREQQVVATAGSFSAISALFGGPLVAGMLMVEAGVGLGSALIPALLPGLVAAAFGYLIFIGLGDWGGLDTTALVIPGLPAYDGTSVFDLVVSLGVGVVAAVLILVVRRIAATVADPPRLRSTRLRTLMLPAGGLAVGALALLAQALGANSSDVLFSGQDALPAELAQTSAAVLVVIIVAKALCYAICLGCGFRGGPVFPAMFLGVGVGTLAHLAFGISVTLAVAVGAAAGMAATTRLLFASLLFASLLVGLEGLDAIPAAVLAASAAWIIRAAADSRAAAASTPSPAASAARDAP
jgi:H+/Cl- antiporter ClcA